MPKVNIVKLFEYTKLLRYCDARRCFWQQFIGIWCNVKYRPDGHCCVIRVPEVLYPLIFHLTFPSSFLASSHTTHLRQFWQLVPGNIILKCWT